jgi:hypothetical protein
MAPNVHGSIAPKADTPLVALVDIDEPDDLTGSVGLMIAGSTETKTIRSFAVVVAGGNVTSVTADPAPSDPEQGKLTVAFRGSSTEEEVSAFNMPPRENDFMSLRFSFSINVPALQHTFMSPNGSAWLTEITSAFATEIARAKFVRIPLTLSNARQFPRRNIPLPGPGESKVLAQCGTRFSRVGDRLTAQHNPSDSFVSRQFIEGASEPERTALQNHEQRHMDITSAMVAIGKVFVDAAGAGKTGAALRTARESAASRAIAIIGAADNRAQIRYDDETQNGTVAARQTHWDANFLDEAMVEWIAESDSDFKAR